MEMFLEPPFAGCDATTLKARISGLTLKFERTQRGVESRRLIGQGLAVALSNVNNAVEAVSGLHDRRTNLTH